MVQIQPGVFNLNKCQKVKTLEKRVNLLGNTFYVSDKGQIFDADHNQRKLSQNNRGYLYLAVKQRSRRKNYLVHRLVAKLFIPNPDNLPLINHKDRNPHNNKANNLEWCSYHYNNIYQNAHKDRTQSYIKHGYSMRIKVVHPDGKETIYNSGKAAGRGENYSSGTISTMIKRHHGSFTTKDGRTFIAQNIPTPKIIG